MEIHLSLIPAFGERFLDPEYQEQVRDLVQALERRGMEVRPYSQFLPDSTFSPDPATLLLGDFLIRVLQSMASPSLGGFVGTWLQAKHGRKVRVRIGDVEAEVQTADEFETLLAKAEENQENSPRKVIPDP